MSYATEKEFGRSFLDRNAHVENDLDRDAKKAHEMKISYGHMKALEYIRTHSILPENKPLQVVKGGIHIVK